MHPERYELVKKMASEMNTTLDAIVGNAELVRSIDKKKFISEDVGLPTIEDIISELEKPGRDPREEFKYARFSESVMEIKDLKEGMMLEGTVTNVTNFGAFVDIGGHQDGLVHISELADRFVDDPKKVVRVGQVVKVRVMKVDPELKRISLSMKTGEPGAHIPAGKKEQKRPAPKSGTDALKEKFGKGRDESGKLKTYKPKFNIRQIMK